MVTCDIGVNLNAYNHDCFPTVDRVIESLEVNVEQWEKHCQPHSTNSNQAFNLNTELLEFVRDRLIRLALIEKGFKRNGKCFKENGEYQVRHYVHLNTVIIADNDQSHTGSSATRTCNQDHYYPNKSQIKRLCKALCNVVDKIVQTKSILLPGPGDVKKFVQHRAGKTEMENWSFGPPQKLELDQTQWSSRSNCIDLESNCQASLSILWDFVLYIDNKNTKQPVHRLLILLGGRHLEISLHRLQETRTQIQKTVSGHKTENQINHCHFTSCQPALAMLMGNLGRVGLALGDWQYKDQINDVIFDPYCGSCSIFNTINEVITRGSNQYCQQSQQLSCCKMMMIGSDIQFADIDIQKGPNNTSSNTIRQVGYGIIDRIKANSFKLPFRNFLRQYATGVLFDPPFGLRENLSSNQGPHGSQQSKCYIQDHSGDELFDRVKPSIQCVLDQINVNTTMLSTRQGGPNRLVYLLPVFPSQKELWPKFDDDDDSEPDSMTMHNDSIVNKILPQHPNYQIISWKAIPCRKKNSIARRIVVMEKIWKEMGKPGSES